jgi:hypothetical protein
MTTHDRATLIVCSALVAGTTFASGCWLMASGQPVGITPLVLSGIGLFIAAYNLGVFAGMNK